jgi:hypothetical protein
VLRPLSWCRLAAWLAILVVGWSLTVRWGNDPNVGNGPPLQFGKAVVGATLLAFIAAVLLVVSGRRGALPAIWARGGALAASGSVFAIALWIRHRALSDDYPDLVAGAGWMWLLIGSLASLGSVAATFALKSRARRTEQVKRRRHRH